MSDDFPSLGSCCACERQPTDENPVRTIVMLDYKMPPGSGSGWGCLQCGLPAEGAISVVCDRCAERMRFEKAELRWICAGEHDKTERVAINSFEHLPHQHDYSKHDEPSFEVLS